MHLTNSQITQLLNISKSAGVIILEVYESDDFDINIKDDNSPLTLADKRSNEFITSELLKFFPDIPVLSEEGKEIEYEARKEWPYFWLVDPLDGTKEFIKRNGEFTVNIALIEKDTPVFGVIHVPVTGETYYGGKEYGSSKIESHGNLVEIKVHPKDKNFTVVKSRSHSSEEEEQFYSDFDVVETFSKGSSLKICMVAEGKAQLYFRGGPTWEWDTAAGHAILLGASGKFVNKDKSKLVYNKKIIKNFGFIASSVEL